MNQKTKNILRSSIFLLAGVCIGLAFIALRNQFRTPWILPRAERLPVTTEILLRSALADPAGELHVQDAQIWWNDEEGYSISFPARESMFIAKPNVPNVQSLKDIAQSYFSAELAIASDVFRRRGFIINRPNSSENLDDDSKYDYIEAYEKDGKRCVVILNSDYGTYNSEIVGAKAPSGYTFEVSCGLNEAFLAAQKEQKIFLDVLGYRGKDAIVSNIRRFDPFVSLSFNFRRTGSAAILKRQGLSYKVLFIGQESPSCEFLKKEHISREVLVAAGLGDGCFSSSGEYISL